MVGLAAHDGAVRPLGKRFLPNRFKQRTIYDRRLLTWQDLILVFDLADIEVVTQQVVQRAAAERNATARLARRQMLDFCPDITLFEVPNQFVDPAEFQVTPEDRPDQLSLFVDDGNLAVLHFITER